MKNDRSLQFLACTFTRASLWLLTLAPATHAATYLMDHVSSPISVVFSDSGARLTVTNKADGFVWKHPDTGGGSTLTVTGVTQPSTTNLNANITVSGQALTLAFELVTTNGELRITLGGTNASIPNGVVYPFPFFPTDGSGSAVVPVDSGYVVPTTNTSFSAPSGMRGMEWFGGTDSNNARAWLALVDTPDDYELKTRTGPIGGQTRLSTAPNWMGSVNNPTHTANRLSYERLIRYRFLTNGGYVAMAKQFRQSAAERGWLKTFTQKQQEDPSLNLGNFIGAPICYLWGDGRSTNLLNAMSNAGISKAHLQVSVNHVDQNKAFPAAGMSNNVWFDAVRARGYVGGFYDIYAATRSGGQGGSPYDGFYYLWPANAWPDWLYVTSSNTYSTNGFSGDVCNQRAAEFAASTRVPAHVSRFNLDACFYDVVCAVNLREDFDMTNGHFATRGMDRANRFNLLSTAFTNATKRLLTGTEQGRTWAVPTVHWLEGKFWIGNGSSGVSDGSWNDNSYPQIMTDVVEPTNAQLPALFSDGWQAPLWDLVFHDCVVSTVHWHRPHNKYLYLWDHQDRWAMLRGQAPLLNLTYNGVQGLANRSPNTLTNAFGQLWSSRWTVMSNRFAQTFTNVCKWHEQVGWMEMIEHRRLATDRSVQMSEFSSDGGASGKGIVVNFGVFDGAYGVTNATWNGALRGQNLSVPAGSFQTYAWGVASSNTPPSISSIANQSAPTNSVIGPLAFTVGDAETPANNLVVTAASSNPTLVPTTNIVLGGADSNRTVTITPASNLTGVANIALTVSDGSLFANNSFTVTVTNSGSGTAGNTVSNLTTLHTNGQTYLTWSEVADAAATYRIYRSAMPFTSTAQFNSANLIGTAAADSSQDVRLTQIRATTYHYRITAAGPDLTATQGLFVHTPVADGAACYAVTAVIGGVEQLVVSADQNTTAAVNETVAMPEPVYQRSFTISSRTVEVYVHWVGTTATIHYPAMGNQNSVAHHLGLVRRGAATTHSLLIRPHARNGSFLSTVTGTSDADEWVLTLDDWMPNSIQNTFWYGYHETFDINTGGPQGTSGLVHDYTTRRAKWEIEWALRTLPLDLNRIYMTGHSMGGIGSHFLSLLMPGKIAAIWTTSAKYDFSFLNDPNPANIWNDGSNERATSGDLMWGTVATGLMSSEGIPVYDRLNAGDLAALFRGQDQPVMIAFHGKNDNIVGWAEKLGFYKAMNSNRHGGMFFFDSGVHNRGGGEWVPQQSVNVLNRYRLDQSYPAFSDSSASGNPGDGNALNGDTFGTINGNLDWDTTNIVDTLDRWEITLRLRNLTNTSGTVLPPASATVSVTPRRLQRLQPVAGQSFVFYNLNASSNVVQSGTATADALGLITVTNFQIGSGSNRLVLTTESVAPLTPTAQWPDLLLTWPSFFYEVFRVEHRPLLETGAWLPLTTNLPAANPATNTTYLHPGVLTEPSGFYRVQRRP